MSLTDQLLQSRCGALKEACEELARRGFRKIAENQWAGEIEVEGYGKFEADVTLPSGFPDRLPEIYFRPDAFPRPIPHIDGAHKSCIAADTGLLLDVSNVAGIIRDSILRAQLVVSAGLSGSNVQDFLSEFSSYWNHDSVFSIFSIITPDDRARQVTSVKFQRSSRQKGTLLADGNDTASAWLENLGWRSLETTAAFYLPLTTPLLPPSFSRILKVDTFLESLKANSRTSDFECFSRWMGKTELPVTLAYSFDCPSGRIFSCAKIPKTSNRMPKKGEFFCNDRSRAVAGFRFVHASHEVKFCRTYAVQRGSTKRADIDYLRGRGGAMSDLKSKCVLVVGCGAVGSHVAERIASIGVGTIRLIDSECLSVDNIYRHTLGMDSVDDEKSAALAQRLKSHYPHLSIASRVSDIEIVMLKEEKFVLTADLIIMATGSETLELRLNKVLPKDKPRIHAWLEPLGIGGHILLCPTGCRSGCYQCLFGINELNGVPMYGNQSAFASVGQNFTKTISGCSGTFTPFSGLDADQTAIFVARATSDILTERLKSNVLWSWVGDSENFIEAGYKLSTRGNQHAGASFVKNDSFARRDCLECSP